MIEIQSRDIDIFLILQRYRYLPTRFIRSLLPPNSHGLSLRAFQFRLQKLVKHGYLNIPQQSRNVLNAHCKDHVFQLGPKAKKELAELGLSFRHGVGYGKQFPHELLVCISQAAMEITCNDTEGLEYVPWDNILHFKKTPDAIKESSDPFAVPVYVGNRKRNTKLDGKPAAIRYTTKDGTRPVLNFPGMEADRAKEPEEPHNIYERANIEFKLRAVLDMKQRRTYRTHYGFKNMYVPFITTSKVRMNNMMHVLEKFAPKENGVPSCSYILFNYIPDYVYSPSTPEPPDLLLTGQWHRVGYPPFNVLDELEAQALRMKKK